MKVKTHTQGIGVSNTKHSTCERLEKGRERKRKARAKGEKKEEGKREVWEEEKVNGG